MNLSDQYCHFFDDAAFEETGRPGFRRRIITGELLQLWFWRIAGGATGSILHHHTDQEQLGMVIRGSLDFRIGGEDVEERTVLGPGEIYLAPKGVWHGDSVFIGDDEYGEVWILDVFSPPRTDIDNPGASAAAAASEVARG
jgi:Cupin domain